MLRSPAKMTRSRPEEREEMVEGSVTRIREFQTIHSPETSECVYECFISVIKPAAFCKISLV